MRSILLRTIDPTRHTVAHFARYAMIPFIGSAVALVLGHDAPAAHAQTGQSIEKGRTIVTLKCARCHAVGKSGSSPFPEAPPMRTFSDKYPIEHLAEALAEGIMSGHPAMPEFIFSPDDIDAILAYLESLTAQR